MFPTLGVDTYDPSQFLLYLRYDPQTTERGVFRVPAFDEDLSRETP